MATMKIVEGLTFAADAGEDLTAKLNYFVKLNSSGQVVLAGSAEKALGTLIECPLSASSPYGPASVQLGGIAKVVAGGAINAGDRVNVGSGGKAAAGSTNPVGIALTSVTADLQVVTVAMVF